MNTGESAETSNALTATGLAFRYAKEMVWSDVSFSLNGGEIASLVGINGSGKSTLLRCLAGWTSPTEGEVHIFGEELTGSNRAVRQKIAFVPDVPVFYDDLTAVEHARFIMDANQEPDTGSEAERLFEEFGLAAYANRYPSAYSRGMKQKLALVLALMTKPQLLLLDEPYGPLDEDAAALLSSLLACARDEGATVLVSYHHAMPQLTPDRVFRIADGALTEESPAASDASRK